MLRSTSFSRVVPQPPAGSGGLTPTSGARNALLNTSATLPRGRGAAPQNQQQQHDQQQTSASGSPRALAMITDLTFAETNQIRAVWAQSGREYLRDVYSLRSLLGELALYPTDEEMSEVLNTFDNKVTFNGFLRYVTYLKGCHAVAASTATSEFDTARAFVALGGDDDLGGVVSLSRLREACQKFHLTIDLDAMVAAASIDPAHGVVDFGQFKRMWELRHLHSNVENNNNGKNGNASVAGGTSQGTSRHNSGDAAAPLPGGGSSKLTNLLAASSSLSPGSSTSAPQTAYTSPSAAGSASIGTSRRPRDHSSDSTGDDDELMRLLVTGEESGDSPLTISGADGAGVQVVGSSMSPRSVLKSVTQQRGEYGGADAMGFGDGSQATPYHSLRDFLLNDGVRRRGDGGGGVNNQSSYPSLGGGNPNEASLRRNNSLGKRNGMAGAGRRYTALPAIRNNGGIIANAADAERAGASDSDDGDADGAPLSYNHTNYNTGGGGAGATRVGARGAAAVNSDQQNGDQPAAPREEKVGYRAPSPMILSEYTATRHRPEGNKLGLVSPRGASNRGTSIGMTRQHGNVSPLASTSSSPMKKNTSTSPRKQR